MFEAILAFFIVLAVLVLAHEFGHFISAKKYGVRVEEFVFALPRLGIVREPWYKAPLGGVRLTASAFWGTIKGLWRILNLLFSGNSISGMVSGPVGIFSIVSTTLDFGAVFLLSLVAVLSVNLAVMNLLPLPALDGGRLLFLAI